MRKASIETSEFGTAEFEVVKWY